MWVRNCAIFLSLLIGSTLIAQDEINPYFIKEKRVDDWGVHAALKFDFISHDFSEFEDVLGNYNVELMNVNSGLMAFELGVRLNRWVSALNFGVSTRKDDFQDSLYLEFSMSQYEFNIGYIAFKSNRVAVTPKIAFMWRRNRLVNSDLDRKISIESYLENRDLDIRINHTYGIFGLDFAYKMYRYNIFFSDYWSVGLFAGYRLKLNQTPWVYSLQNRLMSSDQIKFSNISTSFYVAFHF